MLAASRDKTATGKLDSFPMSMKGSAELFPIAPSSPPASIAATDFSASSGAKPRFLLAIEEYIEEELSTLAQLGDNSTNSRLQVFKQAFGRLADDFRTYKGLLTRIKTEYERALAEKDEQVREMGTLKSALATSRQEMSAAVRALQSTHADQIRELQQEMKRREEELGETKVRLVGK